MKRFFCLLIAIVMAVTARSQSRSTVYVGPGAFITAPAPGASGGDAWGFGISWGYQWEFSRYFALDVGMMHGNAYTGQHLDESLLGASVGVVATPAPTTFRYIKAGVAAGWGQQRLDYSGTERNGPVTNLYGFDAIVRLYAIDRAQWQLFASYQPSFRHVDGKMHFTYSTLTACFGYKF